MNLPPYKSKKSPLFWILMWVTSWPRRTDNVNAPGFDDDNRAKNDPSNPRSSNNVSASTPLMDGWNHLQYSIEMWTNWSFDYFVSYTWKWFLICEKNRNWDTFSTAFANHTRWWCVCKWWKANEFTQWYAGLWYCWAQTRLEWWSCWTLNVKWNVRVTHFQFSQSHIYTHTHLEFGSHIYNAIVITVTVCSPVRTAFAQTIQLYISDARTQELHILSNA